MKSWYLNLSIKFKIFFAFTFIIGLSLILAVISTVCLINVNSAYSEVLYGINTTYNSFNDVKTIFTEIRFNAFVSVTDSDIKNNENSEEIIDKNINLINDKMNIIIQNMSNSKRIDKELLNQKLTEIKNTQSLIVNDYKQTYNEILKIYSKSSKDEIQNLINKESEISSTISTQLDALLSAAQANIDESGKGLNSMTKTTSTFVISFTIIVLIISELFAFFVSSESLKPIKVLMEGSTKAVKGEFDAVFKTNSTDEIGIANQNFEHVLHIFNSICNDINNTSKKLIEGDTDARIDSEKYMGGYKTTAENINLIISSYVNDIKSIIKCINQYADGNFNFLCERFPGKKAQIHENLDKFNKNLNDVNKSINELIIAAVDGDLNKKVDSSNFNGDWKNLINNLNTLISKISDPVKNISYVLNELSKANFNIQMNGEYKGEFKEMQNAINTTVNTITYYINDISKILTKLSNQNLDIVIDTEYIGDFITLKQALEFIINNFNTLISNISVSCEQVASGARSMAESSTSLAVGSSKQAQAIDELTNTITNVAEITQENTSKIEKVDALTELTKQNTEIGTKEMNNMLKAMDDINKASSNISNIIKVIDDIAFQTNILALNAAVEAARAGSHGKGFSVVAEEVRALAVKSQKSAKQTASLIETSISKIELGTEIVNNTADSLNKIAAQINDISDIASFVASTSKQQNDAVQEINSGIMQISDVVNSNSAASEETAAASEQLASQSEIFKNAVSKFILKHDNI